MRVQIALCSVALCLGLAPIVVAQDAVKVDPKHYTVMSENDKGRIVKVHCVPGEKSVMYSHPNLVAVFLNDSKGQFTFPDGKKQDITAKAGDAQYEDAVIHLPENTGTSGMDIILVELKGHTAKAKSTMKPQAKSATK